MKRILITGTGSFIGTAVAAHLAQWPEAYVVDTVDMQNSAWRETDFSGYDAVFHVAGIAHSDTGKVSEERKALYYAVNTALTVETAQHAKACGVGQFIFMSSAIVYGESAPVGQSKTITKETPVSPANFYGDSKVQAERGLLALQDEAFRVVILRPPMIYGKGCKGNYPVLSGLAQRLPLFPAVANCRSVLYVENLAEFVRLMIENDEQGIFWPQNAEHTDTTGLVTAIAAAHGKRIKTVRGFVWALKLLRRVTGLVDKAFGSLAYAPEISEYKEEYRLYDLKQSIEITESEV